jgi:hypothetical protein
MEMRNDIVAHALLLALRRVSSALDFYRCTIAAPAAEFQ